MAEYVDVALLKSQDFQDYSDMDVQYAIDHCPRADVAPRAEVAREVIKEIEDAINKRYDQHVFSGELEDTETEAVMDFNTDLYFDIEKIKEKYGINDADGEE
jgi:hypothetical protein